MDQALADKLNRPDWGTDAAASGQTGYQDYAGMPDGFLAGASAPLSKFGAAAADFGGRLSAGMMAVAVLGLVGLYVATRKYQG